LLSNLSLATYQGSDGGVSSGARLSSALLAALTSACPQCAAASTVQPGRALSAPPLPSVSVPFSLASGYVDSVAALLQNSSLLSPPLFAAWGLPCSDAQLLGVPSITLSDVPPAPAGPPQASAASNRLSTAFAVLDLVGGAAALLCCTYYYVVKRRAGLAARGGGAGGGAGGGEAPPGARPQSASGGARRHTGEGGARGRGARPAAADESPPEQWATPVGERFDFTPARMLEMRGGEQRGVVGAEEGGNWW